MKLPKKYIQILVIIGMGIALLFAGVTASLAWFTKQETVETTNTTITSKEVEKLEVSVPEPSGTYDKYMGQTGIQYNGADFPYMIEYNPVSISSNISEESENGSYLKCFFTESTYIDFVIPTKPHYYLTEEEIKNNFTMRLAEVVEENGEYLETGVEYRYENGFFRNVNDNTLLFFNQGASNLFSLKIYFVGERGLALLEETQEDIDEKFTFAFSDESYMFSKFNLYAVFELGDMLTLSFNSVGYDSEYNALSKEGVTYTASNVSPIQFTGATIMGADGTEIEMPVAELFANGVVDYSMYFEDWFCYVYNEETSLNEPTIYRETSDSDDIKTLYENNLYESTLFNAKWNYSTAVTCNLNYEGAYEEGVQPTVAYVRPKSNYYSDNGYMHYDEDNKTLTLYNPSGSSDVIECLTITAPVRDGYAFRGWSTSPTATYSAGVLSDSPFTSTNEYKATFTENTVLYGIWQEVYTITLKLNESWGSYATVGDVVFTVNGVDTPINNDGTFVLLLEKNSLLYDGISNLSVEAKATIISTGVIKTLTLKQWNDANGNEITQNSGYVVNGDITVYPIWNERTVHTITIDLYQTWYKTALSQQSHVKGTATVDTAVVSGGYKVLFNGSETIDFTGDSGSNLVITNVAEGMTVAQMGIEFGFGDGNGIITNVTNPFDRLTTESNDIEDQLTDHDFVEYETDTPITNDITLYGFYNN